MVSNQPGVRVDGGLSHLSHIRKVLQYLDDETYVLYCNSTGIYGKGDNIKEEGAIKSSVFYQFEEELFHSLNERLTVLRLGGLVGPDRIIIDSLIRKEVKVSPIDPVNFIHQTDVVNIIASIIDKELWGEVYNAVAPLHPTKKEVYDHWTVANEVVGDVEYLEDDVPKLSKTISSEKLISDLKFKFKYKNPLKFF